MFKKSNVTFLLGVSAGLLVGLSMVAGVMLERSSDNTAELAVPPQFLHASATHGADTFAMATGQIADGVEGVFFLDYLTGDIQCSVLNPRTGTLGGLFRHNVILDLNVQQGKTPKYLMVTGSVNFRGATGNTRAADSVVYVMDANTGKFAAYTLPWNRALASGNLAQASPMTLIGTGSARNLNLNE